MTPDARARRLPPFLSSAGLSGVLFELPCDRAVLEGWLRRFGPLSLGDAAKLVAARGRLMQALPAGGVMVAVEAAEKDVAPLLQGKVSLAAVNGPSSVVVAGEETDVLAVVEVFKAKGVRTKQLKVSHAFHSPLMEPMLEGFRKVAGDLGNFATGGLDALIAVETR